MPADNKKKFLYFRREIWLYWVLILIVLLVYLQVGSFEFVNYDTDRYVYENRHVAAGLTSESIGWAFTTFYFSNWHPLTWLSHMLDVELFGMKPGWHHLSNVLLHLVNTLLLFLILTRMTGEIGRSFLVAALFAIHPLHVESVAWIAERKDVLSTFFGLLAVGCYFRYIRAPGVGRYLATLLFFMLSLMSKPMLVTLPFAMLLLDYWPLKRFRTQGHTENHSTALPLPPNTSLIIEKVPLFLVSGASCLMTLYAQQVGGAVGSLVSYPLHQRIINALVSYTDYLVKMLLPVKLAAVYPYPGTFPGWQIWASCLMLSGISILALKHYKSRPWLLVGWLWYLGTLIPVIGLVQAGSQAMADRYTYVPLIGIFIVVAWALVELGERSRVKPGLAALTAAAMLGGLMSIAWVQTGYWKDSITLFEHTLAVTKNNYAAHNNLGHRLLELGEIAGAQEHFGKSIEINPEFEIAHLNLGLTFSRQGKFEQALKQYTRALEINPDYTDAHNNLGNVWYRLGKADKAYGHYLEAIRINPGYVQAYSNLGAASVRLGDLKRAAFFFERLSNSTRARSALKKT